MIRDFWQTELAPTPVTLVVYDENGDRSFHSLQTDTALNQISVENLDLEMIKSSRILHLAGSLLSLKNGLPVYEKAKCHAKNLGRLTCCDLNWRPHMYGRSYAQRVFPRYLEGLDILKISHEELELLTNTFGFRGGKSKTSGIGNPVSLCYSGSGRQVILIMLEVAPIYLHIIQR